MLTSQKSRNKMIETSKKRTSARLLITTAIKRAITQGIVPNLTETSQKTSFDSLHVDNGD